MTPAMGEVTAISIFIASKTIRRWPASTRSPASTGMFQTLAVTGDNTARHPSGTDASTAGGASSGATNLSAPAAAQRSRSSKNADCWRALNSRASYIWSFSRKVLGSILMA